MKLFEILTIALAAFTLASMRPQGNPLAGHLYEYVGSKSTLDMSEAPTAADGTHTVSVTYNKGWSCSEYSVEGGRVVALVCVDPYGSTTTTTPSTPPATPVETDPVAPTPAPVETAPVTAPAAPAAPTVQTGPLYIEAPVSGSTVSGTLDVYGVCTLALDAAGTHLLVDGAAYGGNAFGPFLYPLDTTKLSNGTHTLQLWGHDIGNNTTISPAITIVVNN